MKPILDYNRNINNSVLISSMGRSGSTLLLKILNFNNQHREIFEPFYPDQVQLVNKFKYPLYLSQFDKQEDYLIAAKEIFSGKVRNKWTDKYNRKLFIKKRIIKDIRTNLFLKWIKVNFEQIPIILLFRNPLAVAHSWVRAGFGDGSKMRDILLGQNDFLHDYLKPFKTSFLNAKTSFERLIFFWCIYYYVPLKQFKKQDIYISFYENLFIDRENEIKGLLKFSGIKFDESVYNVLKKPSITTNKESEVHKRGDVINGWKKHISKDQIDVANRILKIFGLENIYSQDSKPNIQKVYKIMDTDGKK